MSEEPQPKTPKPRPRNQTILDPDYAKRERLRRMLEERRHKVGAVREIAEELGVTTQAVYGMMERMNLTPPRKRKKARKRTI